MSASTYRASRSEAEQLTATAIEDIKEYITANWPEFTYFVGLGVSQNIVENYRYYATLQWHNAPGSRSIAPPEHTPSCDADLETFLKRFKENRVP